MTDQLENIARLAGRVRSLERTRARLQAAIREARPHHTYDEIARAAGLTRQRVHQLAVQDRETGPGPRKGDR